MHLIPEKELKTTWKWWIFNPNQMVGMVEWDHD